ncbi:MAG: hypothetical protein PHE55_01040 [Methylococcaceae bacterium]|nr:hypothetical protein [Methylococcaceae bacterium]
MQLKVTPCATRRVGGDEANICGRQCRQQHQPAEKLGQFPNLQVFLRNFFEFRSG